MNNINEKEWEYADTNGNGENRNKVQQFVRNIRRLAILGIEMPADEEITSKELKRVMLEVEKRGITLNDKERPIESLTNLEIRSLSAKVNDLKLNPIIDREVPFYMTLKGRDLELWREYMKVKHNIK